MANPNLYHFPQPFQEFESKLQDSESAAFQVYLKIGNVRDSWRELIEDHMLDKKAEGSFKF